MNTFVKLFEEYGFNIESFGPDSYIADNGFLCVPFTVHTQKTIYGVYSDITAVSFLSIDKEDIKRHYKNRDKNYIGCDVFSDYMNNLLKFTHIGGLCNHDYNDFEIQSWLKQITRYKDRKDV